MLSYFRASDYETGRFVCCLLAIQFLDGIEDSVADIFTIQRAHELFSLPLRDIRSAMKRRQVPRLPIIPLVIY